MHTLFCTLIVSFAAVAAFRVPELHAAGAPRVLKVFVDDEESCPPTVIGQAGARVVDAPCQLTTYQYLCPVPCLKQQPDPCGVISNEEIVPHWGACRHVDEAGGGIVPEIPCSFEWHFDWTFLEPCTGMCQCVQCCGNGTIWIGGTQMPPGGPTAVVVVADVACASGPLDVFVDIECRGVVPNTMMRPGWRLQCGHCN